MNMMKKLEDGKRKERKNKKAGETTKKKEMTTES